MSLGLTLEWVVHGDGNCAVIWRAVAIEIGFVWIQEGRDLNLLCVMHCVQSIL